MCHPIHCIGICLHVASLEGDEKRRTEWKISTDKNHCFNGSAVPNDHPAIHQEQHRLGGEPVRTLYDGRQQTNDRGMLHSHPASPRRDACPSPTMEGWNGCWYLIGSTDVERVHSDTSAYHALCLCLLTEQCRAWTSICPFNDMTLDGTLGVQSLLDCSPLPQKRPNHLNMAWSCAYAAERTTVRGGSCMEAEASARGCEESSLKTDDQLGLPFISSQPRSVCFRCGVVLIAAPSFAFLVAPAPCV